MSKKVRIIAIILWTLSIIIVIGCNDHPPPNSRKLFIITPGPNTIVPRKTNVTGGSEGLAENTRIRVTVHADIDYLQDGVGLVGKDVAWTVPDVLFGREGTEDEGVRFTFWAHTEEGDVKSDVVPVIRGP